MTRYTIIRLGQQGDGIADGPIYAPLTLPGEIVSGELEWQPAAHDVKIENPSPDRSRCPVSAFPILRRLSVAARFRHIRGGLEDQASLPRR